MPIIVFYILKIRLRRGPGFDAACSGSRSSRRRSRGRSGSGCGTGSRCCCNLPFWRFLVFGPGRPDFPMAAGPARRVGAGRGQLGEHERDRRAAQPARRRPRTEGRRLIDGMRFGDEMAIIAAGTHAAGRLRPDRPSANASRRRSMRSRPPTDRPRCPDAVTLGRRLLSAMPRSCTGSSC